MEDQGRPSYKGAGYLVAALYHARRPPTDLLTSYLDMCLEEQEAFLKRDPEVTSKRQKFSRASGIALGNMSSLERRSRGKSVRGEA